MRAMSQATVTEAEGRTSRTRLMIGVTLVLLLAEFLLSAVGLLFLLVAWIGGDRFLSGGDHNMDSYMMAAGFVLAATSYVVARDLDQRGAA